MFSSEPLLKNRLAIKRTESLIALMLAMHANFEFNLTTSKSLRLVEGTLAGRADEVRSVGIYSKKQLGWV